MHQSTRAKQIQKTLGTRAAAGYLRNKGWHIGLTMFVLTGKWA